MAAPPIEMLKAVPHVLHVFAVAATAASEGIVDLPT